MRGKYRFSQGGILVAESENLITTAGKKAILDYVAGYTQRIAGAIVLGIGSTAANVADKSLVFEVCRVPVDLAAADYVNSAVVFKGRIPAEREFIVYEAGVQSEFSAGSQFDSQMLLDFVSTDAWSAGTFTSTNSRMGQALTITAAASTTTTSTLSDLGLDLSGYGDTDQFSFVYRANNAFVSSLVLRLKTDASNYYSASFGTPSSGSYTIATFNKGTMSTTGTPNWNNITSVDIVVTATAGGTASIDIDGLRIEDRDSFREDNVLVSRSVLGTQVTKVASIPLDVEYAITL